MFLREGDFDAFIKLSSHISKLLYFLFEHREQNIQDNEKNLYRKMNLSKEDIDLYESSIGRVICYPAFTSTCLEGGYFNLKKEEGKEAVCLKIKQNNTKNVISISEFSKYDSEKEYLFTPFSFFKIIGVTRNKEPPHIIELVAIKMDKPLEQQIEDFLINETDNLDPEGLDMLYLCDNNESIEFNKRYYTSDNTSDKKPTKLRSKRRKNINKVK